MHGQYNSRVGFVVVLREPCRALAGEGRAKDRCREPAGNGRAKKCTQPGASTVSGTAAACTSVTSPNGVMGSCHASWRAFYFSFKVNECGPFCKSGRCATCLARM